MNEQQKKDLIGCEDISRVYYFHALRLLEKVETDWNNLDYAGKQSLEGSHLKDAKGFLNDSLDTMRKISNTELRIALEGAKI